MLKSYKVMLCPNNKQNSRLFATAGVARFVYNWALAYEQRNYEDNGKFINDKELRKILTQLKQDELSWLNLYSNNVAKQAVKDLCATYDSFFKGKSNYPKYKKKYKTKPSFYIDSAKIKIKKGKVKIEKLTLSKKKNRQCFNWINLAEKDRIPENVKYYNPRVTYDGLNWWLSVAIEYDHDLTVPTNEGIGIDLGIKELAITSDGHVYKNINKTHKIKKTNKRRKHLQRMISKKYCTNKRKGGSYRKSANILKEEKKSLKIIKKLTNIRHDYLHKVTSEIIERKPSFIVLEDLNVRGMMKNRHLSKAVSEQCFYTFRELIKYKAISNDIKIIIADRFYASSKTCHNCGCIKQDLKLKDRIYECPACHTVIDRDLNAAINLYQYGKSVI